MMMSEERAPHPRRVDWGAVGAASWSYVLAKTMQVIRSPRANAEHYREQEQLYVEWIDGMRQAGMPAPNLMVMCLCWLVGIGGAFVLRRRWLWAFVLITLAWMMRAFFVERAEDAERFDQDPPFEAPLP